LRCSRDQSVDNVITFVDFSYSSFSSLCLFVCLFWAASHTQDTRRCCPLRRVSLRSADCLSVCLSACWSRRAPGKRLKRDSAWRQTRVGQGTCYRGCKFTSPGEYDGSISVLELRCALSLALQYRPYSNVLSLLALQCIARCEMLLEICYTLSWSVCQSVCLSVRQSVRPSVRPPTCLLVTIKREPCKNITDRYTVWALDSWVQESMHTVAALQISSTGESTFYGRGNELAQTRQRSIFSTLFARGQKRSGLWPAVLY